MMIIKSNLLFSLRNNENSTKNLDVVTSEIVFEISEKMRKLRKVKDD